MATERVGIVGAGIIGCAAGFELARRGADVTIFEARVPGAGATQASAGILAPYTEAHVGGPLFDLTVRGLRVYDAFVAGLREVSRVPFEYERSGTLEIAQDASRVVSLRARLGAAWAREAELQWLDGSALRTNLPEVADDALGALYCPAHGHVAVAALLAAMIDGCQRLGARIRSGAAVEQIELDVAGVSIRASGTTEAFDRVVLAAGAWSGLLDPSTAGGIRPVRGQLVKLFAPGVRISSVVWTRDCYIVPWSDGTCLVGATEEDVGFDERATAEGVRDLLSAAVAVLPILGGATFREVRVGLRPASPHGVPVLGPGPDPRIVHASGHFRNGILLAPLTAMLLADYILADARDPMFTVV